MGTFSSQIRGGITMMIALCVVGGLAAFFTFILWCCCKAAGESEKTNDSDED